jgi:hypothetical protein
MPSELRHRFTPETQVTGREAARQQRGNSADVGFVYLPAAQTRRRGAHSR